MSDGTVANALKGAKEQYPDVVFVAVNSSASRKSSLDATAKYLKDNKIEIPALLDSDGAVGKMYGARTTPHCYVIDANGTLVYQGAIDDNQSGGGKTNYVVNALTQLKKGEKVSPSETKPYGCSVKY
jgi:peroxiredoxin